jgi:hypothetical protein
MPTENWPSNITPRMMPLLRPRLNSLRLPRPTRLFSKERTANRRPILDSEASSMNSKRRLSLSSTPRGPRKLKKPKMASRSKRNKEKPRRTKATECCTQRQATMKASMDSRPSTWPRRCTRRTESC